MNNTFIYIYLYLYIYIYICVVSSARVFLHSFYKNVWLISVFRYFSCNNCILKHSTYAEVEKKTKKMLDSSESTRSSLYWGSRWFHSIGWSWYICISVSISSFFHSIFFFTQGKNHKNTLDENTKTTISNEPSQ